jgi:hypothetical protein
LKAESKSRTPITCGEYLEALHNTLESISNVSNIDIDCTEKYEKTILQPDDEGGELRDGATPYPSLDDISISFTLYIPYRVQADLWDGSGTESENFRVTVLSTFDLPVAFVEPLDGLHRPSTSVVIVRNFLGKAINGSKESKVAFKCLGPSPFHSDFYIDRTNSATRITCESTAQRGYDTHRFLYDARSFKTLDAAKLPIWYDLSTEIGFFYRIVWIEARRATSWGQISEWLITW